MAKNDEQNKNKSFESKNLSRQSKYGNYSMFDINNLRNANMELERYIKNQERLIENGKKFSKEKLSQLDMDRKLLENNKKVIDDWNTHIRSTILKQNDDSNKKSERNPINWEMGIRNIPNNIQKIYQERLAKNQEQLFDDLYVKTTTNVVNKYKRKKADFTDPKVIDQINDEIQKNIVNKSENIIREFNIGTSVLNTASTIFSAAVDKWYGIAEEGVRSQSNAYENTFTNISVRSGITKGQYASTQWKLNNELGSRGLRNNIASSEVQNMWNSMATNGIAINMSTEQERAEITARAIDNVLTKSIVPYLDTSTTIWDQLITAQPDIQKNIRGINRLNNDIVGANYVTKDLLQKILDDLQPISDSALTDIAMSSAGATTFINSMMKDGNLSQAEAEALWVQKYKQQQYGSQILTSGSLAEKMALTNAMAQGINVFSSEDTPEALANIARTQVEIAKYGPGYGNTLSGIVQSSINDIANINPSFAMWAQTNEDPYGAIDTALDKANKAEEEYKKYGEIVTEDYKNDKNQTEKMLQNITVENFMNELSVVNNWLGNWAGVLKTSIEALGALVMTNIVAGNIGKLSKSLLGSGGSGGLMSLLGAGGIAISTIAGAAAVVAIANAVSQGITDSQKQKAGNNADSYSGEFTTGVGDATSAGAIASYAQQLGRDENTSKWKAGLWDNLGRNFLGSAASAFSWIGLDKDDPIGYNKKKWDNFWAQRNGLYDYETMRWVIATYAASMMDAGNASSTIPKVLGSSITADGVKAFLHQYMETDPKYAEEMENYARKILKSGELYAIGPNRQYSDLNWSTDDLKNWGLYRQGLDTVPYDNFPAILHEGEAVLTATTANTLRNLLDEYNQMHTQSVNFDAIIQTQTTALINKMSEIIEAINSRQSSFSTSDTMIKAKSLLTNSMTHLTSTKNF